jgi:hypothetical protein
MLAQVALGPAASFAAFDDLLAVTMGTVDGDEGHGPLLAAGHSQDRAQCAINLSPSPLLKHYRILMSHAQHDMTAKMPATLRGSVIGAYIRSI